MGAIESLLSAMDEQAIARNVGIPHDEARMNYTLTKNTVASFDEFSDVIADYYNHHITTCVTHGGFLSRTEAAGRAKEILAQTYRRQRSDINGAFNDAHDGTNGGLRVILDKIAEHLKAESVERYVRDAFDAHVSPNSWEQKVDIMSQFLTRHAHFLSPTIDVNKPERYAQNYEELIRAYVDSLKETSSVFRRF